MKMLKKLCLLFLTLFLLSGCVSGSKSYVAYTVYPIGYLLDAIGSNRINTVSIQNNSTVQVAELKSDYLELLKDSSVLFHIGDLEPYMDLYEDEVIEAGIDVNAGDLSILNYVYQYKRYKPVYLNGTVSYLESDFYQGEQFDIIDYYSYDPFIWLMPSGMLSLASDVYDYLSSNYVEQSQFFKENYEKLSDNLIRLDAQYKSLATRLVKEDKTIKFVSMTGSFSCWQKDFNIQVYPVCLSKYGALPTEEQLTAIKNRIVQDGVKYIVYEPNMPDQMFELFLQLENELGLTRVILNNISSLTDSQSQSGNDYFSLMYDNLTKLENMSEPMVSKSE